MTLNVIRQFIESWRADAGINDTRRDATCNKEINTRQAGKTQPDDDHFFTLIVSHNYRTFSVARPISTSISEIIQKRTITRGSGQPLSS
ncbi:hypothetical protein SRABI106_04031 [Rahnella aquatilis]|nr:hypothetical protein SRABI106_04031 [Rahnella aquatilis]